MPANQSRRREMPYTIQNVQSVDLVLISDGIKDDIRHHIMGIILPSNDHRTLMHHLLFRRGLIPNQQLLSAPLGMPQEFLRPQDIITITGLL
jgi:hypothetical protein